MDREREEEVQTKRGKKTEEEDDEGGEHKDGELKEKWKEDAEGGEELKLLRKLRRTEAVREERKKKHELAESESALPQMPCHRSWKEIRCWKDQLRRNWTREQKKNLRRKEEKEKEKSGGESELFRSGRKEGHHPRPREKEVRRSDLDFKRGNKQKSRPKPTSEDSETVFKKASK